jgi:shikimate kinase
MSIALIGYRGSGKSTIGKRLADRLWQKFVDTDELVVQKAGGRNIKQIFDEQGEAGFRDLEQQAVAEACKLQDHVISLGGGAILREENRRAIKDAKLKVIYLRCEPEELLKRIQADPATGATRPSLTQLGGSIEEVRKLLEQREPIYRSVMTAELDVTHLSPQDAVIYVTRLV